MVNNNVPVFINFEEYLLSQNDTDAQKSRNPNQYFITIHLTILLTPSILLIFVIILVVYH